MNYWKMFHKLMDDNVSYIVIRILAYWYSKQVCYVRWRNSLSIGFNISNGTRQGGVLSPYLFSRYIRDLISEVTNSGLGCKLANQFINILAYADDIALLAPSWKALQKLIDVLHIHVVDIDMIVNVKKTVAMVFAPKRRNMIVAREFPVFKIGNSCIQYVQNFKYLGHIITDNLMDDLDIQREIKNMFIRTNVLNRRFHKCSVSVKLMLFKSFCVSFYDIALWHAHNVGTLNKFRSCYIKCIKTFFGYRRSDSVTAMFLDLRLPNMDTILQNYKLLFVNLLNRSNNGLVATLRLCNIL